MDTKVKKPKLLSLSYGSKTGLGKTVLPRLIQQKEKLILDLDNQRDSKLDLSEERETK